MRAPSTHSAPVQRLQTVRRGEVRRYGYRYSAPELLAREAEPVAVQLGGVLGGQLREVLVYDAQGNFICRAFKVEVIDCTPTLAADGSDC